MPTLNWIGKDAVIDHHTQVPFRLLKLSRSLRWEKIRATCSCSNLEALKALRPYYAGQV